MVIDAHFHQSTEQRGNSVPAETGSINSFGIKVVQFTSKRLSWLYAWVCLCVCLSHSTITSVATTKLVTTSLIQMIFQFCFFALRSTTWTAAISRSFTHLKEYLSFAKRNFAQFIGWILVLGGSEMSSRIPRRGYQMYGKFVADYELYIS